MPASFNWGHANAKIQISTRNGPMKKEFWTGVESTRMPGLRNSNLRDTYYWEKYADDLRTFKEMGINTIRHPAPWDEMQKQRGKINFAWTDKVLEVCRKLEIRPVIDFVHHTAFSARLLPKGFLNSNFPRLHKEFVMAFAQRYPWVKDFTLCNEPFVTAHLCGEVGEWYPYAQGEETFVSMVINMAKAICATTQALLQTREDLRFVHTDSCESYQALDPGNRTLADRVTFHNEKRFLVDDLILGKVDCHHTLYPYLKRNGFTEDDCHWFQDNPARMDLRGLDYYRQSEWMLWEAQGQLYRRWSEQPKGLARVAQEYADHDPTAKFAITETNFFGSVREQITWLRFTLEQTELLEEIGIPIAAFTWYPGLDSVGFQHMMVSNKVDIDPVGLIRLGYRNRRVRIHTELTAIYARLAKGEITAKDIPNYGFQPLHGPQLQAYMSLMR
jgi:beta-glucosidase/6-phospho-beta-glucosidase/beta-galactosidase